ncbi:MAG: hypothetical protein J0L92_36290 [Deltaproteobacteria bacterium]|nr:hypothetical protein [Deltaproteobacteria bacterium]
MISTSGLAPLLALFSLVAPASAQTIVESTTSTTAEVTVTGSVTTTHTERVIVAEPTVVVVDQPAQQSATVSEPSTPLVPLLVLRAELTMSGAYEDIVAVSGTALLGLDAGGGWGGGLVVGYTSPLAIADTPSELQLALEVWRDFGPEDDFGFRLVGRTGTALVLDDDGPSPIVLGQLGIGTRVSLDGRIAMLLDARGELRVRPPELWQRAEVSGGFVLSMGLAIDLD